MIGLRNDGITGADINTGHWRNKLDGGRTRDVDSRMFADGQIDEFILVEWNVVVGPIKDRLAINVPLHLIVVVICHLPLAGDELQYADSARDSYV